LPFHINIKECLADVGFQALPLRTTKSFLACSTEKVEKDSAPHKVSCALWREALPVILPSLLKFLRSA
jgi:exportin-5